MTKRDKGLLAGFLLVLAVFSVGLCAYVLHKQDPSEVAAYQNRFQPMDGLEWAAADDLTLAISPESLMAQWAEGMQQGWLETGFQPLNGQKKLQLDCLMAGTQNTDGQQHFGFRLWAELSLYRQGQCVGESQEEMLLGARRADREQIFSIRAEAPEGTDSYRLRITVEPVEGGLQEGSLSLSCWEVFAR